MAAYRSACTRRPRGAPPAFTVASLLALLTLLLAACSSPLSMKPLEPDPGIAASLAVVQSKTQALFDELGRNAAMPFPDYDAIHYRPLLDELGNAQKLARLHERSGEERKRLDDLLATYSELRADHRAQKLSFESLLASRKRIDTQLEALRQMERR